MQAYLDGFYPGDPEVVPAAVPTDEGPGLPGEVDVLVVGAGPAGLVLAAQLAAFPGVRTRVVERRPGPLELGQADGVACRTVEMFDALGLSARLLAEGCRINETVFWRPGDDGSIARVGRVQDVEDDLSEFPHLVLNQARVQDFLLEGMRRAPTRLEPDYGLEVTDVAVAAGGDHPVTVTLRPTGAADARAGEGAGEVVTVRARYVVGCDGARSTVRERIGRRLRGDSANQAWGVMDLLAVTDFPDIRFKAVVQAAAGNLLLIPREGGYLFRLYVDMGHLGPDERVAGRDIGLDDVVEQARRVLHPHTLEVKEVVWWSVYEVGQRLTDQFDDASADGAEHPRVFVAGDACHTHSPKAGQGMNVSMQDGFNLGWKLAAVLEGRSPAALLGTYSRERRAVAQELIDLDRRWAGLLAGQPAGDAEDPLQQQFSAQGRWSAGVATRYAEGALAGPATWQHLATGLRIGERFHSAPVVRLADALPMQLGHAARADGRWRLYAFADPPDPRRSGSRLRALCAALDRPGSPLRRFTPAGADPDAVLDLRAVLQQRHTDLAPPDLPALLLPRKGRYGLQDHEKAFTPDPEADVFAMRGVDREAGCLVVVRPDQYVAHVLPLDAVDELAAFLADVLVDA